MTGSLLKEMNERLEKIIGDAVAAEQYSYRLYMAASEKTDIDSIKTVLKKLAEQEESHKEKLLSLNIDELSFKNTPNNMELDITEEVLLTPIDKLGDLMDILKFAIQLEVKTQRKYLQLAEKVTDGNAQKLFAFLAREEDEHERILKETVEYLGL